MSVTYGCTHLRCDDCRLDWSVKLLEEIGGGTVLGECPRCRRVNMKGGSLEEHREAVMEDVPPVHAAYFRTYKALGKIVLRMYHGLLWTCRDCPELRQERGSAWHAESDELLIQALRLLADENAYPQIIAEEDRHQGFPQFIHLICDAWEKLRYEPSLDEPGTP